jgi:hypothetical protein
VGDPANPTGAEYKVGYGKPPKSTQFQPGRSGNAKGRPKGSRSLATLIGEELDKPITARMGGRIVTMSRRLAMVRRFIEKGMQGDHRAFAVLIKLDPAGLASDASAATNAGLSPEEAAMFLAFLKRVSGDEPEVAP